jgi:hypothetical protein
MMERRCFFAPVTLLVDLDLGNGGIEVRVKPHRYSQPNRTIRGLDAVAIDKAVAETATACPSGRLR